MQPNVIECFPDEIVDPYPKPPKVALTTSCSVAGISSSSNKVAWPSKMWKPLPLPGTFCKSYNPCRTLKSCNTDSNHNLDGVNTSSLEVIVHYQNEFANKERALIDRKDFANMRTATPAAERLLVVNHQCGGKVLPKSSRPRNVKVAVKKSRKFRLFSLSAPLSFPGYLGKSKFHASQDKLCHYSHGRYI